MRIDFLCMAFTSVLAATASLFAADRPRPEWETVRAGEGEFSVAPVHHATFALRAGETTIWVDPVGGVERFAGLGAPDVVLVTDVHGDHLDAKTLGEVAKRATIVVPEAVRAKLAEAEGFEAPKLRVLANGASLEIDGLKVTSVPMYNTTEDRRSFHEKGRGNGYVIEIAGARVYVSGDTEDIPEMRALEGIDLAFVCMNLPYTMTAEAAASAVAEFRPRIVYPYHFRGRGEDGTQDPEVFAALVRKAAPEVEVRVRDWYAGEDIGLVHPGLRDPALATEKAPDEFWVRLDTSEGEVILQVKRDWAPRGADRFYNLVKVRFYDDVRFFRVIDGFMAQVGLHGDPSVNETWRSATIPDDPVSESNQRGWVTFAKSALPNSRTTQIFFNFRDNKFLDGQGFAPFARVAKGMEAIDRLYSGYGEGAPGGNGPSQARIAKEGNAHLDETFPELDRIRRARVLTKSEVEALEK